MHAEDPFPNSGTKWKTTKDGLVELPQRWFLFPKTRSELCVETIGLVDDSGLMVPSEQMHLVWMEVLQRQEENDGFRLERSSVHIVSQKEKVFFGWFSILLKHSNEIRELTMNVTNDNHGRFEVEEAFL